MHLLLYSTELIKICDHSVDMPVFLPLVTFIFGLPSFPLKHFHSA